MKISQIFERDINRKINGVIKVNEDSSIKQEIEEYVITNELKKHFIKFFNAFDSSYNSESKSVDVGVWISGFYGSGKSHFLKMLSYLLCKKQVEDSNALEMFRPKFEGDTATFMTIDRCVNSYCSISPEVILFNIARVSSSDNRDNAIKEIFAKMFYNHLGFYGEDLKLARLEQFIDSKNKTNEFRAKFKEINGSDWIEERSSYSFLQDDIIKCLNSVLGMSNESAENWFNGVESAEISIVQLVKEIKKYIATKPANFRLLFMIDEVGQFIGTNTNMLIDLQTIVEEFCSQTNGQVWVVCTGQEAIDDIIKVRINEFSKIQARFKTRLSMSSSSVGEVIQKRILKKTDYASNLLKGLYEKNDSILRNFFIFSDSVTDINGYKNEEEFCVNYPFIPYQFTVLQNAFTAIRKHGNSGNHHSDGERSMLEAFQEAAQKVQNKEDSEGVLVPFYEFYDTLHSFLDSTIKRVIERCARAVDDKNGLEKIDLCLLKLLYLIRYIEDIPSNLDNIAILMANSIYVDKIELKKNLRCSLDRLLKQNYISITGDTYRFLTDEEQDIQRDIRNTEIEQSEIVTYLGKCIIENIYKSKKVNYKNGDFSISLMVDDTYFLNGNDVSLKFVTMATDVGISDSLYLINNSVNSTLIKLADGDYFNKVESILKINKFAGSRNMNSQSQSAREIIEGHRQQSFQYEKDVIEELKKAILDSTIYVCSQAQDNNNRSKDVKLLIDEMLSYQINITFDKYNLVYKKYENDEELRRLLKIGPENECSDNAFENAEAVNEVLDYISLCNQRMRPLFQSDIMTRYRAKPYGWSENAIVGICAILLFQQKIQLTCDGLSITKENKEILEYLRNSKKIGKVKVTARQLISKQNLRKIKDILISFCGTINIVDENDEDLFVNCIIEKLNQKKTDLSLTKEKYSNNRKYPGLPIIDIGIKLCSRILNEQNNHQSFVKTILSLESDLLDNSEDFELISSFFKNQISLFDSAVTLISTYQDDLNCVQNDAEISSIWREIQEITDVSKQPYNYSSISKLTNLITNFNKKHEKYLSEIRNDITTNTICDCKKYIENTCIELVKSVCDVNKKEFEDFCESKLGFYNDSCSDFKNTISGTKKIIALNSINNKVILLKDTVVGEIERKFEEVKDIKQKCGQSDNSNSNNTVPNKDEEKALTKTVKKISRDILFNKKVLSSEEDIDEYLKQVKKSLIATLKENDTIEIC